MSYSTRAHTLHESPWMGVFYVTGGGVSLLAELLNTAGASATVLEASVPYATTALADVLRRAPDQATSGATARQLAMAAYERAQSLADKDAPLFGFGCTASLATNRVKKGAHRAHWAIQTANDTFTFSATFDGTREEEEAQLLEGIWHALLHCLISHNTDVGDEVIELHAKATPELSRLLNPAPTRHCVGVHNGRLILPGTFYPWHDGHKEMLAVAEERTGMPGAFELAVRNADKPSLDFLTIQERIDGLGDTPVWLTNTPTFEEKAKLFPGATFVLGVDTMQRISELRFYRNHVDLLERALRTFHDCSVHFLVFGRLMDGHFTTLDDLNLPTTLAQVSSAVPEDAYRNDTSSTAIRQQVR